MYGVSRVISAAKSNSVAPHEPHTREAIADFCKFFPAATVSPGHVRDGVAHLSEVVGISENPIDVIFLEDHRATSNLKIMDLRLNTRLALFLGVHLDICAGVMWLLTRSKHRGSMWLTFPLSATPLGVVTRYGVSRISHL